MLAWVGLGSNIDDPAARLREACERVAALPGVRLLRVSPFYLTPPWGPVEQPDFVNAVAELDVVLEPTALLGRLLDVEQAMGRQRRLRWGPRRIDLDLLHVEGHQQSDCALQLPHPRLGERAFVLRPWLDLQPGLILPGVGALADLAKKVDCSNLQPLL